MTINISTKVCWDFWQEKPSRTLKFEFVIAKTIAGFMSHHGGSLLIGVADDVGRRFSHALSEQARAGVYG